MNQQFKVETLENGYLFTYTWGVSMWQTPIYYKDISGVIDAISLILKRRDKEINPSELNGTGKDINKFKKG